MSATGMSLRAIVPGCLLMLLLAGCGGSGGGSGQSTGPGGFTASGTLQISVIMQVTATSQISDAGYHYVSLIDTANGQTVQQQAVAASNGVYPYTFSNVAAGTYEILAGSDLGNDGRICDAGEACGGYVTLDQLTPVSISGDMAGLDFSTGYNVIINLTSAETAIQPLARVD